MKTKQKKSLKKLPMIKLDYGLLLLFFVIPKIADLQNLFLLLGCGFDMV